VKVSLRLLPAPANSGIVFKRTDLDGFLIEAQMRHVARVSYATSLMKKGVLISTTEHLLSALSALGVDNVLVEIDNMEIPILDGSSLPFARLIEQAGLRRQRARRLYAKILAPIEIEDGAKRIAIYPSDHWQVDYHISFPNPIIGKEHLHFELGRGGYAREIAPARTFGTFDEVKVLQKSGLARGGSLENAVVVDNHRVMNPEGLRFPDEFCRHKVLDLIGDLALMGHPLVGRIEAERAGHAVHYSLVSRLWKERRAWKLVTSDELSAHAAAHAPRELSFAS
jgi:UDP-3-O-[3-hydroxymyristoyl] N-acetylglucosamine deacetylase